MICKGGLGGSTPQIDGGEKIGDQKQKRGEVNKVIVEQKNIWAGSSTKNLKRESYGPPTITGMRSKE